MGTTDTWALPYPESTDPPNGPVQFRQLADATDAALSTANGDTSPRAFGSQGAESISSNSETLMPFPTIYYDYSGMYDRGTRLFTVPEDGIYDVKFLVRWATSSVASRRMLFVAATYDSTATNYAIDSRTGMSASFYHTTADSIPVLAGTTLAFYCYQDSGGSMNLYGYHASITKIGTLPPGVTAPFTRTEPLKTYE